MNKIKIHVTLTDYKKKIYRKIEVLDRVILSSFCENIIRSFNGDLSHLYTLIGNDLIFSCEGNYYDLVKTSITKDIRCYLADYVDEEQEDYYDNPDRSIEVFKLEKGNKLKLKYDFGDNWEFIIKISSIENIEESNDLPLFKVIKGKGLGIIEDCGGLWGLSREIYLSDKAKENNSKPEIDMDEFDILKQEKYTIYKS